MPLQKPHSQNLHAILPPMEHMSKAVDKTQSRGFPPDPAGHVIVTLLACRAALALARVDHLDKTHKQAGYFVRFGYPHERAAIMQEAAQGLADMRKGFGPCHLLVVKMHRIYDKLQDSKLVRQTPWTRR